MLGLGSVAEVVSAAIVIVAVVVVVITLVVPVVIIAGHLQRTCAQEQPDAGKTHREDKV